MDKKETGYCALHPKDGLLWATMSQHRDWVSEDIRRGISMGIYEKDAERTYSVVKIEVIIIQELLSD